MDTLSIAKEARKLNLKRTQGEWRQDERYIVAKDRPVPEVARTGTIRATENAKLIVFLVNNLDKIVEDLESLVRLRKLIEELEALENQSGDTVGDAEATSIPTGTR